MNNLGFFVADSFLKAYLNKPSSMPCSKMAQEIVGALTAQHRLTEISFDETTTTTVIERGDDKGFFDPISYVVAPPMSFGSKSKKVTTTSGLKFEAVRNVLPYGEQLAYLLSNLKRNDVNKGDAEIIIDTFKNFMEKS